MTIRPIICIPDPRLRLVSAPVGEVDHSIRELMDDMLETMYDAPGIGLAAIQIAVPKRVIVIDTAKREDADAHPLFFADPVIVWSSEETAAYQEGCLSIPEYYEEVTRPTSVRVRFLDRDSKAQELEATGILATCIQHEIDHLNGVLFLDYLSKLKRDRVIKKFTKAARRGEECKPYDLTKDAGKEAQPA